MELIQQQGKTRAETYRRVRVTAPMGWTKAGQIVSGHAEGRKVDSSTRFWKIENSNMHEPRYRLTKVRMEAWGRQADRSAVEQHNGRRERCHRDADLPFPLHPTYCIGATRQGFPIGSLRSALTGPVADAKNTSLEEGMAGLGLADPEYGNCAAQLSKFCT